MESPAENPSKAAEYLKELNKIIETQQELLEKQKRRIDELEQQVAKLYRENAFLQDEHHRHLATCRLQQGILPAGPGPLTLGAIEENAKHEKSEGESSRSIRQQKDEDLKNVYGVGISKEETCVLIFMSENISVKQGYKNVH